MNTGTVWFHQLLLVPGAFRIISYNCFYTFCNLLGLSRTQLKMVALGHIWGWMAGKTQGEASRTWTPEQSCSSEDQGPGTFPFGSLYVPCVFQARPRQWGSMSGL